MRYELSTLVDITNTSARRGDNPVAYRQNQNYLTVIQVLGLRTNVEFIDLEVTDNKMTDSNFGSVYKGTKKVWTFTFEVEREGYHSLEQMIEDFNLVPIITDLEEDAKIEKSLFQSKDSKHKNIYFKVI
jgi:hypothetical protein